MEDFFGGIGVIILIIIFCIGFFLFIQFASKSMNRGIRINGAKVASPDDFGTSIELIKKVSSITKTKINYIGKSYYQRILYDIDKLLNKSASKKFTHYLKIHSEVEYIQTKCKGMFDPKPSNYYSAMYEYQELFPFIKNVDINKILEFFEPKLNFSSDEGALLFLDKVHLENMRPLEIIIKKIEIGYRQNKLTYPEANKIRSFLLVEYFDYNVTLQ